MTARCVMVWGATSGAGKSWLATALCRWYAGQGLRVAPFKAQNMSNNARVAEGGEIGSAQYFQALAARRTPEVRMNPVLLKPERDTHSQFVLLGQVDAALTAMPWRERSAAVWPHVARALDALRAENDVVVIEGAGSPAEINLRDCDYVNLRTADHADARCLLVADIDRGGAFAHLYGTWALLEAAERARIRGFVLNRFRGDPALLEPGPGMLQARTGVPTVATLPMWRDHGLPEEDGMWEGWAGGAAGWAPGGTRIAVIAYPRISNLDEFQPLRRLPGVQLAWAREPRQLQGADWVVLPGSKHTSGDLAWLRAQGLDAAIAAHAAAGGRVLGICGGLQMLGEALVDPHGIDGNAPGLGLLPVVTLFEPDKRVRRTEAVFAAVPGPWQALSGLRVRGYEIRHGRTAQHPGMGAGLPVLPGGLGWCDATGRVLGVYLHGLLEDPGVLRALFGANVPTLDDVFDGLAACLDRHVAPGVLRGLLD
ncbi:cobyric acid synthase [Ramlibacter sp. MAHUQ-53]|uniref:cobyric acid synthase n=1 Tax=unclassified Ramlibacter TaxID=2617605 RepID=UPI0036319C00